MSRKVGTHPYAVKGSSTMNAPKSNHPYRAGTVKKGKVSGSTVRKGRVA